MTILNLTPETSTLPTGVKNIKLETFATGPKGAHVTTYLTDTPLNYRMTTEDDGATFVLADEKIKSIAGAGGKGLKGGVAGQPASLPVLGEKSFAYVNDTSEEVHTDMLYEENNSIFFLAENGSLVMPFGYRIDPSTPEAVWPYLGFTTTRVLVEADQVMGSGPITLTTGNNTVTWDTFRARLPTGTYTLEDLLDRITTIFQTAGDRGFRAAHGSGGKIQLNTLYTVRFTNPTGSLWTILGFTKLTLIPPGPPVKPGQVIPIKLINDGLTATTFPTDVDTLWYTAPEDPATVELELELLSRAILPDTTTNLVAGKKYKIATLGTVDWDSFGTSFGPTVLSSNLVAHSSIIYEVLSLGALTPLEWYSIGGAINANDTVTSLALNAFYIIKTLGTYTWANAGWTGPGTTPSIGDSFKCTTIGGVTLTGGSTCSTITVPPVGYYFRATGTTSGASLKEVSEFTCTADTMLATGSCYEIDGIYRYNYNQTTSEWTPGKKIRSSFALPNIGTMSNMYDTASPFLFSTSGSLFFRGIPNKLTVATTGGEPLMLKSGVTPFFTLETWVNFANDPQTTDEKIMFNNTCTLYREATTGNLGFKIRNQKWVGTTPLKKDIWYHLAVVAKPRNPITGPLTSLGVQAGMVCSGPGIKGYALVNADLTLTPAPESTIGIDFLFESSGITLFLDGLTEMFKPEADAGVVNWTALDLTDDTPVNIGIQKPLLGSLTTVKTFTGATTIEDVAANEAYFFLLTTEGINVLTPAGEQVSILELVGGKKIVTADMWVYVATTNKIYGYTIGANGILNPLLGSTDIGAIVLNMAISRQGYIYVVTSGVLQTLKIELDGSLTAFPSKTIVDIKTIVLNPAGTYAYVTTATTLLEYAITDGILSTTQMRMETLTVLDLVITDTEIYLTTAAAGLSVYKTGSLATAPKTQALTGAKQIAVDPTGRIYVRQSVDNNIYIYRLTAAGVFEAGLPVALTLTDTAFFYADATAVWTTTDSAKKFNKSLHQAETGGYVSNVRITGEPVYQGNFYPSVRPLAALPSTTLLLLCEAEEPLKNSASLSFISFYDNFTVLPAANPLNVPGDITLAEAGCYILSFDYTNDTTGNKLYIQNQNFDLTLTTEGKFNQAVYLESTTTFYKEAGAVSLTNIRLKRIRTTDLGKGGSGTPVGGQGFIGGASGGALQPLGSAGGRSFPALDLDIINSTNLPQGATVTYLNGITPIPKEIDATELIPSNYYRITVLGTLGDEWLAIGADASAVGEDFQCTAASGIEGGKCILVTSTNEVVTEQYTTFQAETWIAPTVAMVKDMITYGQNVFLTGKRGTAGGLMLFDGTDWTPATSPTGIIWQGLTYSPEVNLFLGVTHTGDIWTNTAIKSTDWQLKYAAGRTPDITRKVNILYGPTGFVIIDDSSELVFRSNKTGTKWTKLEALPAGDSYNGFAKGSTGEIVAVGNSTVVSSKDGGLTWQAGTITVADDIVGVVYGHQGFKIITVAGGVFRRLTPTGAWVADADTIGITDITAVGYGGGKYIALNAAGDYALGNTWDVQANQALNLDPKSVVFGQGIFLTATGYQLGDYDTAAYTATLNPTEIEITRSTSDGLKTLTTVSIEDGIEFPEFLVINGIHYLPFTGEGLVDLNLNGQPMLTSGAFSFNTVYRKVQVELVGASGGGAGGHAARVILRGARLAENIFLSVGVAGTGTGPTYPGGGATVLYTLDGDGKSTGFVVAGGGGGAGANGSGGNAAENTGQRGQDGSGSPGSGGSDEEPGLPDGQPKIQIGDAPTDLPGQVGSGGGGLTGGGNGSTSGGGGGGGGSGTEGLTYMSVSYETADETGNGSVRIMTLPELKDDPDRDDATILYLIQPPLPSHYAYSRTISYVVNIDAQSNVQITARTAELETVTEFVGDAQQYETVVIIESDTKNTTIFGKTPPICFQTGTGILTPTGYVPVERLKEGDLVLTARGETVPIVKQVSFQTSGTECPLYCLPVGGLATGVPLQNLYLSHNHAYKVDGHWHHMKCSTTAYEMVKPFITYHHLYLPDYFRYTLIAEGVEVESAFEETRYLRMGWLCEETECVPLKCSRF